MTVETFFANFGHLADAPNGVKKLRELILQLAVQGKLVPQDSNDEPASVLLDKIKAEKERMLRECKVKKSKTLPKLDAFPYELPSSWQWARLNDVYDVRDGTHDTPKYVSAGFPLVTSKNLSSGKLDLSNVKYISEEDYLKINERSQVDKLDVLFAMIGSIGNPVIVDTDIDFSIKNVALFKYYSLDLATPMYLCKYLVNVSNEMREKSAGGVQSFVSLGFLRGYPIPLPPLEEQKRIVAKVDQLMALCNELEARQQKQQQGRVRLNNSTLDALLTAREPDEFSDHWQRICNDFDLLYDHPGTIGKLRAAILQLAVQGKLVPQDPNDEPASVLLERIKAEKERLVKERKYQKTASQQDLKQAGKAIDIPVGWVLSPIGELCPSIVPNRDKPKKFTGNIPWVTLPNLDANSISINFHGNDLGLSPAEVCSYNARLIPGSSVIMSCVGRFGLCAVTSCEIVINQQLHAFVILDQLDAKFIAYSVKAHSEYLGSIATSTTIKYLNKTKCESIPIALPPREEQIRIVAKVDQLMALCDELEAKLNQTQQHSEKLMEATVRQLLVA